ncbi:MAG: hypothetical protein AAB288_10800 [Acidobacteriota bacterium]
MSTIFDDPLYVALIGGQNRAQYRYQCAVHLDLAMLRKIFHDASVLYAEGREMKELLQTVVLRHVPFEEERVKYGYKAACGLEFYRRKVEKERAQENLDRARPPVPLWVYEQEM